MTALCKPSGGVRCIVAGDMARRFVARTISQQISKAVEQAMSPFQCALSTKSGGECVAHSLQALTDLDPRATVLSINGIGAFDLISRGAMLDGLRSVAGGDSVLPFVVQFCGNPSSHLWDDDDGETHEIRQGEGGEQGDPLVPMLYALGQHQALRSVQSRLRPHERLLAFHDDVSAVAQPERIVAVPRILGEELWQHSRIRIEASKTQIWNRGGHVPSGCETLLNEARAINPHAEVWFGGFDRPPEERGIRVLGTPLGSAEYVRSQLDATEAAHQLLLQRIPAVQDLQSAWLLLLFCASSRATFYLRVCHPDHSEAFARQHDVHIWQCLSTLLGQRQDALPQDWGSLPFHLGGLGLRSAHRSARAAFWAVGQIDCTLSANVTETLPAPCWTPSKALQPLRFTSRLPCHVVSSWPRSDTIVLIGSRCWMVCVLDRWILTRWTLVCLPTVGSFSLLRLRRDTSAQKCCGLVLHRHSRLSCVRNRARLLDFPSWPCHLRPSHGSLPNFSACFFSAACGFPCPCLLAPAGVAVHSTSLATTTQRARGQVYWPVAASLSKALLQGCAGRQVPASPPTCSFGTWTCQSHVTMVDDWKSWLTGFHCSMVLSSPLTPHWSLQFVQTVSPGVSVLTWTALLSPKPVVSSSALIQNSRAITAAPSWLFSQLRSEAVGQRRLVPS